MAAPIPLYHWSPESRRASIQRLGLLPGRPSIDGEWRPPYVCLSATPSLAWALSGAHHPEVDRWDLWMVWSDVPTALMKLRDVDTNGRSHVKEYRVRERIWKRDIWYVATRGAGAR